ncbi:MAG: hypothetical protein VYC39_03230 [Myxococcota bacterium]|nr:hypothetical protein [Myxococcota bacterium]
MQAFIIKTSAHIVPFGEHVSEMPVGGVPLQQWQSDALTKNGLEVHFVESEADIPIDIPRFVTFDNVFFTFRGIRLFIEAWKKNDKQSAQFALPKESFFVRNFSDLQDCTFIEDHRTYPIWLLRAKERNSNAATLPIDFRELVLRMPVPKSITGFNDWEHTITTSIALEVSHWLHVFQMNLLSIQTRWVEQAITHPVWSICLLLKAIIRRPSLLIALLRSDRFTEAHSLRKIIDGIAPHANIRGTNVSIHPTAIVEGCIIGDNVKIGAQALVRNSIISAGSTLQERVNVAFSVVGKDSFVSKHSVVHACASFEEADMCMRGMQFCLVGRRAALTTRATPIDISPDKPIRVEFKGTVQEVKQKMLGTCFGHNVFIGADVYIAPGRSIPNNIKIVSDTSKILTRVPDSLEPGETYAVKDSTLHQIG